jgi:hypothetical protein
MDERCNSCGFTDLMLKTDEDGEDYYWCPRCKTKLPIDSCARSQMGGFLSGDALKDWCMTH